VDSVPRPPKLEKPLIWAVGRFRDPREESAADVRRILRLRRDYLLIPPMHCVDWPANAGPVSALVERVTEMQGC